MSNSVPAMKTLVRRPRRMKGKIQLLPQEVLDMIFEYLLTNEVTDITIQRIKPHKQHPIFRAGYSKDFLALGPASNVCIHFRKSVLNVICRKTKFISEFTNSFLLTAKILGNINTSLISSLELWLEFEYKVNSVKLWPPLITCLSKNLPRLKYFRVYTWYINFGRPYPAEEAGDVNPILTRDEQERRAIIRFGAFLVLRHPLLKRMVYPADSGPMFNPPAYLSTPVDEFRTTCAVELHSEDYRFKPRKFLRWKNRFRNEKKYIVDTMYNTTATRRKKWSELGKTFANQLALPRDARCSEVVEDSKYYSIVDKFGYTSVDDRPSVDVDSLIEACKYIKALAVNCPWVWMAKRRLQQA